DDRALGALELGFLAFRVFQDVEQRALRLPEAAALLLRVLQDVEQRGLLDPHAFLGELLQDTDDGAGVPAGRNRVPAQAQLDGLCRGVHGAGCSPGAWRRSSAISFFSSTIFSSRPTVSFWKRSSSARRSISLARCSATSDSAFFCAVTSRAAAKTPSTLPAGSRYTEAL